MRADARQLGRRRRAGERPDVGAVGWSGFHSQFALPQHGLAGACGRPDGRSAPQPPRLVLLSEHCLLIPPKPDASSAASPPFQRTCCRRGRPSPPAGIQASPQRMFCTTRARSLPVLNVTRSFVHGSFLYRRARGWEQGGRQARRQTRAVPPWQCTTPQDSRRRRLHPPSHRRQ